MSKILKENENTIKEYCIKHNLDFNKAKRMHCNWNDEEGVANIQYFDKERAQLELARKVAPKPCPTLLRISIIDGQLHIEETEYTREHLSLELQPQ